MIQTFNNITIEIEPTENLKDYFNVTLNGHFIGSLERSEIRYIIQELDNTI